MITCDTPGYVLSKVFAQHSFKKMAQNMCKSIQMVTFHSLQNSDDKVRVTVKVDLGRGGPSSG